MRINQFEFLLSLNQYGSFSNAASHLFISQPSISRAIKELEDELGFPVIRRTRTGISFTQKGQQVLAVSQDIMNSIQQLRSMADEDLSGLSGTLNVACVSYLCSNIMMEALATIHHRAPLVQIRSNRISRETLLDGVRNRTLDLGIIHVESIEWPNFQDILNQNDLAFYPLFSDPACFLMNSAHPLCKKEEVSLEMVSKYSVVLVKEDRENALIRMFREQGHPISVVCIDDIEYTRFIQCSDALSPCSVSAARQICAANKGATKWRVCSDFQWFSEIGWIQRNEPLNALQRLLVDNLQLCASNYSNPEADS